MTAKDLADLARLKTGTNSTTFADADMLTLVNVFKDEISSLIVERNNGMFLVPYTFDLVDDQREYPVGDDVLNRIHKVEIKFDSTSSRFPSNYIKDYGGSETESEIVKNFSNTENEFAHTIRRRALFILSGTIVDVTGGVRVWAHVYPADLDDMTDDTVSLEVDPSTTTFGFPRQFHELLARRVGMEYKSSQPTPLPFSMLERNYERDLEKQLAAVSSVDNSGEVIGEMPAAEDLWYHGFTL